MKNSKKSRFRLNLLFLLLCTFLAVCIFSVTAHAETACYETEDGIACTLSKSHYLAGENITATYRIRSEASIADFTCTPQGFTVVSSSISADDEKEIIVTLSPTGAWESAAFSIEVLLSSGNTVGDRLYATQNEYGVFVSILSLSSSYED